MLTLYIRGVIMMNNGLRASILVLLFGTCVFSQTIGEISNEKELRTAVVTGGRYRLIDDITVTRSLPMLFVGNFYLEGAKERSTGGHNKYLIDFNGYAGFNYHKQSDLSADTLMFTHLRFENARSDSSGGTIRVGLDDYTYGSSNKVDLVVRDVIFRENQSKGNGGAIYFNSKFSNLTIENSFFGENQAGDSEEKCTEYFNDVFLKGKGDKDPVAMLQCNGGAVAEDTDANSKVTIANSTFYNNTAYGVGGALLLSGANVNNENLLEHVSIVNNYASMTGGGVFNHQKLTVKNAIIYENSVADSIHGAGTDIAGTEDPGSSFTNIIMNSHEFVSYTGLGQKNHAIGFDVGNHFEVINQIDTDPGLDTLVFREGTYVLPFLNQRQTNDKPTGIVGLETTAHDTLFDQRLLETDFIINETTTPLPHYRSEHGVDAYDIGAYEYVNHKPYGIRVNSAAIPENAESDQYIGSLSVQDQDTFDSHIFTVVTNAFAYLSGDSLYYTGDVSLTEGDLYELTIVVVDDAWIPLKDTAKIDIEITESNKSPYNITLDGTNVKEGQEEGTLVGVLSVKDKNSWDLHEFTITGLDTEESFEIVKGTSELLVFSNEAFVAEERLYIDVVITATDKGGLFVTDTFRITVENVNRDPIGLSPGNVVVVESANKGIEIAELVVEDPDGDTSFEFTILVNSPFMIIDGVLVVNDKLDYSDEKEYILPIEVNDNNGGLYLDTIEVGVLKGGSSMEVFLDNSFVQLSNEDLEGYEEQDEVLQVVCCAERDVDERPLGYSFDIRAEFPVSEYDLGSDPDRGWSRSLSYSIMMYDNLGQFVDQFSGEYDLNESGGVDASGMVLLYVHMAPLDYRGLQASSGRLLGDGVYILSVQLQTKTEPHDGVLVGYGAEVLIKRKNFTTKFGYIRDN